MDAVVQLIWALLGNVLCIGLEVSFLYTIFHPLVVDVACVLFWTMDSD